MSKCEFCESYAFQKNHEDEHCQYTYDVALVVRISGGSITFHFPNLHFCPLCGKELDGE